MLFKSYLVNKNLRPAAAAAAAYEPVQKHKVIPVYRGDLISAKTWKNQRRRINVGISVSSKKQLRTWFQWGSIITDVNLYLRIINPYSVSGDPERGLKYHKTDSE